jgi:hypothetical protein
VLAYIEIFDETQTDSPIEVILDNFKYLEKSKVTYDEADKKVKLRNNFDVKINTSDFDEINRLHWND